MGSEYSDRYCSHQSVPGATMSVPRMIRYEVVRPHLLPAIHKLMYQSFWMDEPLITHLGIRKGSFSVKDGDQMVEDMVLNHNLSILASDRNTGLPLAVCINGVMRMEELDTSMEEVTGSCIDPRFGPLAAILFESQVRSKDVFTRMETEELFDLKCIATAPGARGLGLATDLVRRSILLAKCLGYKGFKAECTGATSKYVGAKCGLVEEVMVSYSDFTHKGQKPFQGLKAQGHQGISFMALQF